MWSSYQWKEERGDERDVCSHRGPTAKSDCLGPGQSLIDFSQNLLIL